MWALAPFANILLDVEHASKMIDFFAGLYLEDRADSMSPITAIALYDEFKELTPPGKKGAEMVQRLADRLVEVDLLDRAAELLQDQVEFRLDGIEKARVGAQLALVYIFAQKFVDAIENLGLASKLIIGTDREKPFMQ